MPSLKTKMIGPMLGSETYKTKYQKLKNADTGNRCHVKEFRRTKL